MAKKKEETLEVKGLEKEVAKEKRAPKKDC